MTTNVARLSTVMSTMLVLLILCLEGISYFLALEIVRLDFGRLAQATARGLIKAMKDGSAGWQYPLTQKSSLHAPTIKA